MEHTATELSALLGTMSFWAQLSTEQREAIQSSNRTLHEQLGRPIRSSVVACLVTARCKAYEPDVADAGLAVAQ